MKRILAALLALVSSATFATTLNPVQLLNPAGSSAGQAIVSTGSSSAPSFGVVGIVGGGTGSATATGATANLQYLGSGTGATARSVASKLGDIVSVSDFGAPTGADDTTAFSNTAAAAIAGNSQAVANPNFPSPGWAFALIPPGTYTLSAPVNVANKSFVWYAAPGAVINGTQYLNGRLERIGSKITSQSSGITDNATTFTIAANQNIDEQAQVSGFTDPSALSAGNGRDTVAAYIGNTLPASLYSAASVTSYSATGATLATPLTSTQLGQLRVGMIVTTQHTPQPYAGVLTAWTSSNITVSNWYLVTGTAGGSPVTPTGTNGLDINTFRKVWAFNANAFIASNSWGSAINTAEFGMSNTKGTPQSMAGSVESNGVYVTNLAGSGAYAGDAAFFASGGSLSGGGWTWGYKVDGGVQVPFYYNGSVNPVIAPTYLVQAVSPANKVFFTVGPDGSMNVGPQGASNTTTILFHSGATNASGGDAQINVSGGTGATSGGTMGLYSSTLNLNAGTVINANTVMRPGTDNAYGLGQSSFRWSSIYGVTGNFTNLNTSGTITPSSTAGIVGTTTNDNANAGSWGEYFSTTGTGTALTSGSYVDLATQSLTAGDWDTQCIVNFNGSSLAASVVVAGINTVANTQPGATSGASQFLTFSSGVLTGATMISPVVREPLSATTTVRCGGAMTFSAGTVTATGTLTARRRR